ncbi:MAG: hypothetical protein LBG15_13215 [Dysgonamonadaceae bacterium]|nr:hypothetical protein [Dysgonamonadaceae bacterium]
MNHYETLDSLKLTAVSFLLDNLPYHFYNSEHSELYESANVLNRKYKSAKYGDFDTYLREYQSLLSRATNYETKIYRDEKNLSADFLIQHIDSVFAAFEQSPWRKYTSFNNFCEYLLPYCISREKREMWINVYRKRFAQYYLGIFQNTKKTE